MDDRREVLVLGIGNMLWADEGFGVRAVEALNAAVEYPAPEVLLLDGGTLGLNLLEYVEASRRVLVFDAVDFGLPPGTLKVLRDDEVPRWGARKMSPHQNGFNDILALAQLHGRTPDTITAIGVQPVTLDDFGGSLTDPVRARLAEAVELAAAQLAEWGFPGRRRAEGEAVEPLNAQSLALGAVRSQPPDEGRRLPHRRSAPARRAGALAMCVGIPMQVERCEDGMAECAGRGRRERLNAMLLGDLPCRRLGAGLPGLGRAHADRGRGASDERRARRPRGGGERHRRPRRLLRRSGRPRADPPTPPEGHQGMSALLTDAPALHPLLEQLSSRHGFVRLDLGTLDAFADAPGHALLVFTEDPVRFKETLDLAVIAPELAKVFAGRFRCGVLLPPDSRKAAARYGFARWPALVMLKDGRYVGAVDGLRMWQEYVEDMQRLLEAEPTRAPTIGIAVNSAGAAGSCH